MGVPSESDLDKASNAPSEGGMSMPGSRKSAHS